jgi:hypothetical protein
MRKRLKTAANILFHIISLSLIALGIVGYRDKSEELLLIVFSIFFYILSLASYIVPKFSHRILYKWGEFVLKSSGERIEYEGENFKKYLKYRYWFTFLSFVLILINVLIKFL